MKQMTFADAEYAGKRKQTRKELFLIEMDQVVPWKGSIALIKPHYPKGESGRPSYPLMAMLRAHLMQNWFGYSDPAMEEALYETTILRQFAGLSLERMPGETPFSTSVGCWRGMGWRSDSRRVNGYLSDKGLLLRQGTIVDATLIHASSSTKNQDGKRDPEMHQTKKGNQYYFGMKAHIGVDDESGLVHTVWAQRRTWRTSLRLTGCCMGRKTWSVPMQVAAASRNALNMKDMMSSGKSPLAAAHIRS
nr:IS5 family transposase [Pseudomonas sp. RIT-PI-AD]